jgi:adenylylsulfate kinase
MRYSLWSVLRTTPGGVYLLSLTQTPNFVPIYIMNTNNIYPIDDRLLQRQAKETLLQQKGKVFWMTGLSGSGKSTLAQHVEAELYKQGYLTQVLDGDNIRNGLNKGLGFSDDDRLENIRRVAEVAKLFCNCGVVTFVSFISPKQSERDFARSIIGSDNFAEVYISAPYDKCEERDVKGLYAKARAGEIKDFIGLHTPYEAPTHPELEISTHTLTIPQATDLLLHAVLGYIQF